MENLITQNLEKDIETEHVFTLGNNFEEIFEKCLLINGVKIIHFVEASDSHKRKSTTV